MLLLLSWLSTSREAAAQNFWQRTSGPNAADLRALAINSSGHIFAASYGGGIFRSMDDGASWTAINSGLTNMDVQALVINSTNGHFLPEPIATAFSVQLITAIHGRRQIRVGKIRRFRA